MLQCYNQIILKEYFSRRHYFIFLLGFKLHAMAFFILTISGRTLSALILIPNLHEL